MNTCNRMYVADVSLISSVGGCAVSSAAAINAGVSAIRETAFLNKKLKPIKMAMVPDDALPLIHPSLSSSKLPSRQLRLL